LGGLGIRTGDLKHAVQVTGGIDGHSAHRDMVAGAAGKRTAFHPHGPDLGEPGP
jgi:hypothetical protein